MLKITAYIRLEINKYKNLIKSKIYNWFERMINHIGNEKDPTLKEAAVGNFGQWAQAWSSNTV